MNSNKITLAIVAGLGLVALIWYTQTQTDNSIVPETQDESQVMGLGVQAAMRVNAGTPLDVSNHHHGWHPGYDPDPTGQPVTQCKVRYPAIPGGNISTVMHKGWNSLIDSAPAGRDWFYNPPEASVL